MEQVGKLLNKAGPEKSLATTQQPSQPSWAGLLWTLAQSRSKELTTAEVALWKAKLSGYPADLVEWALINYNGEFFPNPSTICRMVEVKRESLAAEHDSREWNAWKANQTQAAQEGKLATEEDYTELREVFRKVAFGPPLVPLQKPVSTEAGAVALQKATEAVSPANDSSVPAPQSANE